LARLLFFVVDGKLLKIVSLEYVAAIEAGHIIDSITPHQKLGALVFTARHSEVRIIPILMTAVTLSSPFLRASPRPYRILTKPTKVYERNPFMKKPAFCLDCRKLFALGGMLFAMGSVAAAAPNLAGEWKLNVAKSAYGKFPAPQSMVRKIAVDGVKLSISTVQKGAQGEVSSEYHYTTDGKPATNKVTGGESKGSAQWIGDKLMVESSRDVQGATLSQKEIWTLSADGKTLTVDAHVSLPNGEFDVKQVFER
jgi:hypothetical protein